MSDRVNSRDPGVVIDWTASISVSVIIIILVLIGSVSILSLEFPYALSGTEVIDLKKGDRVPNYIRNLLEIVFFASQILLFITAIVTLLIAKAHAKEAENARTASTYMQIAAIWSSERVVASRMYLLTLRDRYRDKSYQDDLKRKSDSLQSYIKNVLHEDRKNSRLEHSKKVAVLTFLEDIGVLCKRGYVKYEDVIDFIAAPITLQTELLWDYIQDARGYSPASSTYANALLLYERARRYRETAT